MKYILVALAPLLLAACEMTLPSAPSSLTTGIVIYEHANSRAGRRT